jgi:hypothetical protein
MYLIITKLFAWLRLSRRRESWKTAEILLLRHQLTVLHLSVLKTPSGSCCERVLVDDAAGQVVSVDTRPVDISDPWR